MSTVLDEVGLEDHSEVDLSVLATLRAERDDNIVLAFDLGTSGARAALFDGRGREIPGSQVSLLHQADTLTRGADTEADELVEFATRLIDIAVARAENFVSRIDYVASASFWHSLVGVDDRGCAVTPLLSWADTRAAEFVAHLRAKFNEREIHQRTGARFHPSFWPAKLLWLKNHRPAEFARASQWLSFADYFFLKLFGDATTGVSMASATGLFNQRACAWDDELIAGLGLQVEKFTPIARAGQTFRQLSDEFALRWPLLDRAAWFPAIGDGAANNIGAGCVTAGRLTLMIGTSGAMRALFAGSLPEFLPPELFCYRADRDRVVIGGALSEGGGLYRWMKDSLALNLEPEDLELQLDAMDPDSHGLTILPFWFGERSTGWSADAKGSIIGLTSNTKPIEIVRASMEAICYRFALVARALDAVAPRATIVAAGNALRSSALWTQMLADVLGRPVALSAVSEATSRGAALLALEATGKIESLETIDPEFDAVYEPDMNRHRVYARAVERQQELYAKLIQ